jgi:hypothetical protein
MSTKIFVCPQCGTDLVGVRKAPKLTDVAKCPVHGIVGTIEELASRAATEARNAADEALKAAGVTSTKNK